MLNQSDSGSARVNAIDTVSAVPVDAASKVRPKIALVTPYNGGNLGDAAIQDSVIANIRLRLPGAQFSGICLNLDNFIERHGTDAFPICAMDISFYHMLHGKIGDQPEHGINLQPVTGGAGLSAVIKKIIKSVWPLWGFLKRMRGCWRELRHWVEGYHFLRMHDLVIVSGGGQLNEEWGGAWGQPFALFKWAVLARCARVPYVLASVGVGRVKSRTSRLLISNTFRLAQYRSYRDKNTRAFAAGLLKVASEDPIVPDHVLALPRSEMPCPSGIRVLAQGRPIVAISPIAYAKPQRWPTENRGIYDRYMIQMADVMSQLLERGYFLVVVCSSLWDDESAIADLLRHLNDRSRSVPTDQMHIPAITTWRSLVGSLLDVDFLIASRLHSVILGLVAGTPTVAISFEPKVEWVMQDLGQTGYLVTIGDFVAKDVISALDRISVHRNSVAEHVAQCRRAIISASAPQYDALAEFALASRPHRTSRIREEMRL
jgi:polysaccharide pyruvyl transferase WcaK-like protein